MNHLLTLKNVTVGYNHHPILKDVSFDVADRDFIGVIGPNGGGKTTLLKTMLGLLSPFEGKVVYAPELQKGKRIGYLPQSSRVDKKFPISVEETILSGLMPKSQKIFMRRFSKKERENVYRLLKWVGLETYGKNAIGELSGGEQQKVLLCRAIVANPELLILDEPNTYVDNKFEGELYEMLRELNERMAIVMVSHDIGTITSYVKSIACVNRSLHHHHSNRITETQLAAYDCPIQLITHGRVPHTVLEKH
jgi:zinc transport system ATP-binding protein